MAESEFKQTTTGIELKVKDPAFAQFLNGGATVLKFVGYRITAAGAVELVFARLA